MLHVEGRLALALGSLHAGVEGAQRHHVTQAFHQFLVGQGAGPGADGLAIAVEHADDRIGEIADFFRVDVDWRHCHRTGLRDHDLRKVGRVARTHLRLRYMEAEPLCFGHCRLLTNPSSGPANVKQTRLSTGFELASDASVSR